MILDADAACMINAKERKGRQRNTHPIQVQAANFRFRHTNLPTDVHMSQAESKLKMVLLAMQNKLLQPQ